MLVELEHLKIETTLIDEMFASVMGEGYTVFFSKKKIPEIGNIQWCVEIVVVKACMEIADVNACHVHGCAIEVTVVDSVTDVVLIP